MKRVLLVDDEPETLALLEMSLAKQPYETTFCSSGIEALCRIFCAYQEGWCYDALVLDCALPHFDGFTIAKIVRLSEKTEIVKDCRSKIAAFTAYSRTVEQSTLMQESQIDKYWRKPDDITDLGSLIREWLEDVGEA